jgi:hypothetical protein
MIERKSMSMRTTVFSLLCVVLLFLSACSKSTPSNNLIITMNWLGVRSGNHLKFYNIDKGFEQNPKYDFKIQ